MRALPAGLGLIAVLLAGPARADAPVVAASSSNLDGFYLTIGPVGGLVRIDEAWYSAVGLELSLVRVAEKDFPAGYGLAGGGVSYGGRDGGRLWLEAEVGIERPLPFALGLGVGLAAEVDPVRPPRFGPQATLWLVAGVVPYLRAGTLEESGPFAEFGLMIKLPRKLW